MTVEDKLSKAQEILSLARDGMSTDGAHHKQWYLEKIFRLLAHEEESSAYERYVGWEGTPP